MRLAWSKLTRAELRELLQSSIKRWGTHVAQRYLEDVQDAAKQLVATPALARPLKGELRIFRVRSHYLIVQADPSNNRLIIARVLHVAMDIERHLP